MSDISDDQWSELVRANRLAALQHDIETAHDDITRMQDSIKQRRNDIARMRRERASLLADANSGAPKSVRL